MNFHPAIFTRLGWASRGICAATLALSLSGLALARQDQAPPDQPPQTQDQAQPPAQQQPPQPAQQADRPPQSQQAQPQNPQAPPPAATQDSNRPPITSVDRMPQNSQQQPPDQQNSPQNGQGYGQPYGQQPYPQYGQQNSGNYAQQNAPSQPVGPPPPVLTIPKDTVIFMRLNDFLSSDHNQIGDQFTGTLDQPIVVNGWVVARRGQTVVGQVKSVKKAGRIKGTSQLGVELTNITLVNGQQAPILTELWKGSGGTSHGADAGTIAGGTGLGAAIGAAADWGTGAAIGAGAGAVAGIGAVLLTRGRPTVLGPESQLTFRLVDPVKVDTTQGQQAFLPVSQRDFNNGRNGRPVLRMGNGYYGGYPPYGAYPYGPYGYAYPGYYYPGYVGIYPAFGWGWGWGGRYGWRGGRRW
jgi:hypothetical protein